MHYPLENGFASTVEFAFPAPDLMFALPQGCVLALAGSRQSRPMPGTVATNLKPYCDALPSTLQYSQFAFLVGVSELLVGAGNFESLDREVGHQVCSYFNCTNCLAHSAFSQVAGLIDMFAEAKKDEECAADIAIFGWVYMLKPG